jgi:hypothetical protein
MTSFRKPTRFPCFEQKNIFFFPYRQYCPPLYINSENGQKIKISKTSDKFEHFSSVSFSARNFFAETNLTQEALNFDSIKL